MGSRNEDGEYSGTLPKILARVGLHPKVLVRSGEKDPDILAQYNDRVLGHLWRPGEDVLIFTFPVNLSQKDRKGVRKSPDLVPSDIPMLPSMILTKRRLLGFIMSLFDPTGLTSPITLKLK